MPQDLSSCSLKCHSFKCCPALQADLFEMTSKYHFSFLPNTRLIPNSVEARYVRVRPIIEKWPQKVMGHMWPETSLCWFSREAHSLWGWWMAGPLLIGEWQFALYNYSVHLTGSATKWPWANSLKFLSLSFFFYIMQFIAPLSMFLTHSMFLISIS